MVGGLLFMHKSGILLFNSKMQILTRGQTNTLVFTLTESSTIVRPIYLFEITNKGDINPYCFIATDISSYIERYNRFTIQEVTGTATPENKYNGIIKLYTNGEYAYRIFEQTSSTNLNPANATNTTPIETGFIKVEGSATNSTYYIPTHKDGKVYKTGK